jgi:predicted ferric reductase
MELTIKKYNTLVGVFTFILVPIILYFIGDFIFKTKLKETLSIITIISYALIFSQFFISRINEDIKYGNKLNKVVSFHKYVGYTIIAILFLHPLYVVIPRYFEAGTDPVDAFFIMITNYQNLGVLLGIISWILMLFLGLTSFFRFKLGIEYKNWKILHGVISLLFIITSTWHFIKLSRHNSYEMNVFFVLLVFISTIKLLDSYFVKIPKNVGVKSGN